MATTKQVRAARKNIKRAQRAARSQRTIAKLPPAVRRDLGKQAAKARQRGGRAGHGYEDRTRQELYEVAKRKGIPGRSSPRREDRLLVVRKLLAPGFRLRLLRLTPDGLGESPQIRPAHR